MSFTTRKSRPDSKYQSDPRYHSKYWRVVRQAVMLHHKCCPMCEGDDKVITIPQVADHIVPVRWEVFDFFDRGNLWGICNRCHARKSKLEGELSQLTGISKSEAVQVYMRTAAKVSITLQRKLGEILKELAND